MTERFRPVEINKTGTKDYSMFNNLVEGPAEVHGQAGGVVFSLDFAGYLNSPWVKDLKPAPEDDKTGQS